MKTLKIFIAAFCTLTAGAQSNIERLLPLLGQCDSAAVSESIYTTNNEVRYSVYAGDKIHKSLLDSLVAAFQKDAPLATESDLYQKHTPAGDTISYTLVYNGTIKPEPNSAKYNTKYHSYGLDIHSAASLDIRNDKVWFQYYGRGVPEHRLWQSPRDEGNPLLFNGDGSDKEIAAAAYLAKVFDEIAADSRVKSVAVSYDITDGNYSGSWQYQNSREETYEAHTHGIRLEIPQAMADHAFARMTDAIETVSYSNLIFSYGKDKNDTHIIFGENWEGDAFCLRRMKDGRVFILHTVRPETPCCVAIPLNWNEVDIIKH